MNKIKSLAAAVLLCCSISYGRANTILTDPGPGRVVTSQGNLTLGFDFTVGSSPIELTALGLWDENLDGFTNAHSIGLWDSSGTLLAQAFIVPGIVDPLVGQFRYATIIPIGTGPVILLAGTTYVLGASYLELDADSLISNIRGNQATFDPAVLPGNIRFSNSVEGFVFPNDASLGPGSFVGPNAQFNGVPEGGPGICLLLLVLTGLAYFHRRFQIAGC